MQGSRRSLIFDGAADVGEEAAPTEEQPRLTQSSSAVANKGREDSGPSRADEGLGSRLSKRRSFISFASRAVEIHRSGGPTLARSSSLASMSAAAAPPPALTRGDSVSTLGTSRSIPKDLGSDRDEVRQEEETEVTMKEAMESVQLRKRARPRKQRAPPPQPLPSPRTPEDEWEEDDINSDHPDNANLIGNYLLGGELGKGTFGTVYKALHTVTGEFVAIKEITTHGTEDMTAVMGEVELLKRLDHPNIVELKDMRKKNNKYYLALEYIENGSLKDVLKKFGHFPESLALVYVIQLLQGLAYLHDSNIIHRDIKGANILITKNGTCKLADFGLAAELRDKSFKDPAGSVYWMAPELFDVEGDEATGTSKASDVWSLGCTVIELITGKPPYSELSSMAAIHAIVEDELPPLPECSKDLTGFLKDCLRKNPSERLTANQLLRHPWIVRQTPQKSGDYNMLTRQLRDHRKSSVPSPGQQQGRLRAVRMRRQSISGLTHGNLLVRRLSKLTSACPAGRLEERLTAAGVELNEEALHVLESHEQTYGKLGILASELHCDMVSAQDSADELATMRTQAEFEAGKLQRHMENMRSKLKLLEENFNQSDEVLARLVYGSLQMDRFANAKKGVLKVKRPHDKWRKRHVVLKDNFVLLFKPNSGNSPADVLWLDRVGIEPQASKLVGEKFAFKLNTRKRTLLVCAANDKIMVSWMKELSFPTPWYEADDFDNSPDEEPSNRSQSGSSLLTPKAASPKSSSPLGGRRQRTSSNPVAFERSVSAHSSSVTASSSSIVLVD